MSIEDRLKVLTEPTTEKTSSVVLDEVKVKGKSLNKETAEFDNPYKGMDFKYIDMVFELMAKTDYNGSDVTEIFNFLEFVTEPLAMQDVKRKRDEYLYQQDMKSSRFGENFIKQSVRRYDKEVLSAVWSKLLAKYSKECVSKLEFLFDSKGYNGDTGDKCLSDLISDLDPETYAVLDGETIGGKTILLTKDMVDKLPNVWRDRAEAFNKSIDQQVESMNVFLNDLFG